MVPIPDRHHPLLRLICRYHRSIQTIRHLIVRNIGILAHLYLAGSKELDSYLPSQLLLGKMDVVFLNFLKEKEPSSRDSNLE